MGAVLRFDGARLADDRDRAVDWPALAVLGDPVAHSLSPRLHAAALAARGFEHEYRAVHVAAEALGAALDAMAASSVIGCNLTVPHKEAALDACAYVSDEAREIGATNTLVRREGAWRAHNTDARGLALALQSWQGRALASYLKRTAVIGAGGAARAAVVCLRAERCTA